MSEPEHLCLDLEEALAVTVVLEEMVIALDRISAQVATIGGSTGDLLDAYVVESKVFRRLAKARREIYEALDRELGEEEVTELMAQRVRYFPN